MANSEPYVPSGQPFHKELDSFRVWQTTTGFAVSDDLRALTYRGNLAGVARFIARQRSLGGRS